MTLTDGPNRGHCSKPFLESIAVGRIFCSFTLRVVRDPTRIPSNIWGIVMNDPWFLTLVGPWVTAFAVKILAKTADAKAHVVHSYLIA